MKNPAALQLLQRGVESHRAGRLPAAKADYEQALRLSPKDPDALHFLGVVLGDLGQVEAGIASIRKALALLPRFPDALYNLGNLHLRRECPQEAITAYEQALRLNPKMPDALARLGNALEAVGRSAEARKAWQRSLDLDKRQPETWNRLALNHAASGDLATAEKLFGQALKDFPTRVELACNFGNTLRKAGRPAEALAVYRQALVLDPACAEVWNNVGIIHQQQGRLAEAIDAFQRATTANPGFAEGFNSLGAALCEADRPEEARAACSRAIVLSPRITGAHLNLGNAQLSLNRADEAVASFRQEIVLYPDFVEPRNNLAVALRRLNRGEEALAACRQAIALGPAHADSRVTFGNVLLSLNRIDEALASYRTALEIQPENTTAHVNQGIALLLAGRLRDGFREYEWRWRQKEYRAFLRDFGRPGWTGEQPLAGKTILVHAEQGFGDTLQFARYARLLTDRGARVILEVQPPLKDLLAGAGGVDVLLGRGDPLPPFDLHCPMLSLPHACGTDLPDIPPPGPWLRAPRDREEAWRAKGASLSGLKVGLVWSGFPGHPNDRNRSIPLAELAPILGVPGVDFVSLQKEVRPGDRASLTAFATRETGGASEPESRAEAGTRPETISRAGLRDWSADLRDFADTAALVAHLDLVIAVDTSVAHLAASLGRPVWVLVPFAPDWRWLLGREDNPWYPTVRVWRQGAADGWTGTIAAVAEALRALAERGGP